jgi:hypothetical protein
MRAAHLPGKHPVRSVRGTRRVPEYQPEVMQTECRTGCFANPVSEPKIVDGPPDWLRDEDEDETLTSETAPPVSIIPEPVSVAVQAPASGEPTVAEVIEPPTPAPKPEQAPTAPPQPAASWQGKKPPCQCNAPGGICRYSTCKSIGCCQMAGKLDDDPTAGLPFGVPARKSASSEPPPVPL